MIEKLVKIAKNAQENSYSPYSNFKVGAAILADNGKIYASCNVEVAHYKAICAEAGAISAMIADGAKKIDKILIISPNNEICPPCGDCLQRIREFYQENSKIILANNTADKIEEFKLADLLPHSFGPENL